jgi:uncharacterized membrane protein (Fun14 family)
VNLLAQKARGVVTELVTDGPWRAKSVITALAAAAIGLWFWVSDLRSPSRQHEVNNATTNSISTATSNPPDASSGSHWNWSRPFPFYTRMGASYVVGFCLGWFFRKLLRLIVVVVAVAVAVVALGRYAGLDTTHAQEEVKRSGKWAEHEVVTLGDHVKHLLPSAATGGVGTFLGFRRRNRMVAPQPPAAV